jgi:hypothetical protein
MRFFRILSLIFIFAALFFGGVQLFYRMQHLPADLTLGSLLENVAISREGLLHLVSNGSVQTAIAVVLQSPAWLVALCLGGLFWVAGSLLGDGEG